MTRARVPVTILTGFLGAGKTTLVNRILAGAGGRRYGVIVNEFGELGIDGDLIVGVGDEVIELSNGCVCCALRTDLIASVNELLVRNAKLDAIVIETTGLAAPGPIAQTLMMDEGMRRQLALDAVVTVVDAKHLLASARANPEVDDQIAFADVIVLNKVDLVGTDDHAEGRDHVRRINASAELHEAVRADIALNLLFGKRAFGFDGTLPDRGDHREELEHHHGDGVGSVSLIAEKPLDTERFHRWMVVLLALRQPDLLRVKGILDLEGEDQRYAFQAVQTISGGAFIGAWPADYERQSRLVLIGRGLDADKLRQSFTACQTRRRVREIASGSTFDGQGRCR